MPLPYDPAIMLLGIYPKEMKTYFYLKTCTQLFTAALFIIAKTWKQPRCLSVGEWKNNNCVHPDNGISFSAKKKNELISHVKTWRKLKCILLSERSQSENATYCMIPTL